MYVSNEKVYVRDTAKACKACNFCRGRDVLLTEERFTHFRRHTKSSPDQALQPSFNADFPEKVSDPLNLSSILRHTR